MAQITPLEIKNVITAIKIDYPFLERVPTSLVMGISEVESTFDPSAVGSAGEIGLMQVKPSTGEWILGVYNLPAYGPHAQINNQLLEGMCFLNWLMDKGIGSLGVIHSYNVGLKGYQEYDRRNWTYVAKVLEGQVRWLI